MSTEHLSRLVSSTNDSELTKKDNENEKDEEEKIKEPSEEEKKEDEKDNSGTDDTNNDGIVAIVVDPVLSTSPEAIKSLFK